MQDVKAPAAQLPGMRALLPMGAGPVLTGSVDGCVRLWHAQRPELSYQVQDIIRVVVSIFGCCRCCSSQRNLPYQGARTPGQRQNNCSSSGSWMRCMRPWLLLASMLKTVCAGVWRPNGGHGGHQHR